MFKEKRFYGVAFSYTLGVFNDNAFKTAVIYLVTHHLLFLRFGAHPSGPEAEAVDLSLNSEISVYFFLPFVLFATVSGWACDRFSRSKILKLSKFSEVIIMTIGAWSIYQFQTQPQAYHLVLLAAVFAMALQSTFFSPARNGIIPQLFTEKESSEANGKIEMMQFMGIIFGIAASALALRAPVFLFLFPAIALLGYLFSMQIPHVPAENPGLKFNWNIFGDLFSGTKSIFKNRPLTHCIIGQAYFYALGVVLIACIMNMAKFNFGLENQNAVETQTSIMLATLSIGMGVGCFMAGKLSRGRIELGLVPIGMAGMIVFILLFSYNSNLKLAYLDLALLGIFSGFFILPLKVYIQQRSDKKERGKILAIDNFISFAFMLGASYFVYKGALAGFLDDSQIILRYCVVVSVFVALIAFYLLPEFVIRFILVTFTRTIYKMKVKGEHHIPEKGPVLLLPNHVTWMDGFMITAATSRQVKFLISDMYYNVWFLKPFFKWVGFIPVPEAKGKKAIVECLKAAKDALENGEVVCIFPEGQLTRSGVMSEFKTGFTRMLPKRDDLTIIPMYLGMAWGSVFSFKYGKNIRPRIPSKIPYPLDIRFGKPLPLDIDAQGARRAVRSLENAVESQSFENEKPLHNHFFKHAKRHPFQSILQDSDGKPVKNIVALMKALTLRNWIKETEKEDEKYIGIILPPCVTGSLTSLATMYADKIPVFLNFTASKDAIEHAVNKCSMKRVLTSKLFMRKIKMDLPENVEVVYLEDMAKTITGKMKSDAFFSILQPAKFSLKNLCPASAFDIHSVATVLFSSGSTGTPKGVVLTHYNFTANLSGMLRVANVSKQEILLGTMPLFHCFGFLSAFWMPLFNHNKVVYHPNPLESAKIGEIVEKFKVNVLFGTPTFLNNYARKCKKEQMTSLRLALCGAEKLRKSVAESFFKMSGTYPVEAYGATELSPAISVNIPTYTWDLGKKPGKSGSVGHPIPGVIVKAVNPDTGEELKYGEEGLILVKGPNVMQCYLDEEEKTAAVLKDGWYNTGDLGSIDPHGYIMLTGRMSRFSKIAGEMVPHGAVEEAIHEALNTEDIKAVVVGKPDEAKGEKLVVFHLAIDKPVTEIIQAMKEKGIPSLWIPKPRDFIEIEQIPLLGSGKLDLQKIKELALVDAS